MKRNYNHRIIRSSHLYTYPELSELLGIDISTIRRWRKKGLKVIDPNSKPLLIFGRELIRYIKHMSNMRSTKLSFDEFYCCHCRKAVRSEDGKISILFVKRNMHSENSKAHLRGRCQHCKTIVHRFSSQRQLLILENTRRLILTDGASLKGQAGHAVNACLRRYDYEQK